MTGIERVPLTDDRQGWLRARLPFVNASEMATVCGRAGYGSLAELYAEKKGLIAPKLDSGTLRRGRWGEAAVFQALADERPEWNVARAKVYVVDHDRRIGCTPDGFARAPGRDGYGVVEAKVVARSIFRKKWLVEPDGSIDGPVTIPEYFRIQTATVRMLNADRCPWAVLAVVINGEFDWTFRLFDVEPDPVLEDRMVHCATDFLTRFLDPGIMPPFEPQRDEALVKALYPKDNGTEIDLSGDNRALVATEELTEVQAALKRLRDREKGLKTELTGKLGEHTFGRLADARRLSWRMQHREVKASVSDFRVLRILKAQQQQESAYHDE